MRFLRTGCRDCGHPAAAHRHYRPGSDCARCPCPRLRRTRRRAPAPPLPPRLVLLPGGRDTRPAA